MTNIPPDDTTSNMSDEVFEDPEATQRRIEERRRNEYANADYYCARSSNYVDGALLYDRDYCAQHRGTSSHARETITATATTYRTPSPSGYPGYRPPREAVLMYAFGEPGYKADDYADTESYVDGWKSYKYEDFEPPFDDTVNHKTILLGDSGVGKTSFLVKYNTGEFRAGSFSATVGIALTNKVVMVDSTRVKLQIWDTAGQERFRSVTHAYYRDAHALLLLYDITNKTSFDNIRAWLVEIREYAQEDVVIMLLGNKADCSSSDRQVKREEGERLAREYNVAFMETSAKTGVNVELAFLAVARQLKCRRNESVDEAKFNVQDFVREQTQVKQNCSQCSK